MLHHKYMRRCLDLARLGLGNVSPNPLVGCVIVENGEIIGEGWHLKYGTAHAEVNAVEDVIRRYGETVAYERLLNASVYVNLEPCAHFGKTPPCADLLIQRQVKNVYIGNRDPFAAVDGKGISKLQAAGIEVETGILEKEAAHLNRRFFTRVQKQRPYVILKWAQTANGIFAPADGSKRWITGEESRVLTHKWRAEEDAVLVGKNTSLADDPELTVRFWEGRNPLRVLVDRRLQTPAGARIFNDAAPTVVLNEERWDAQGQTRYICMEDMGSYLPQKILYQLHLLDVQSLIIEGGAGILRSFIEAGLWDEARVLTGPVNWESGLPAPVLGTSCLRQFRSGADQVGLYFKES